MVVIYAEKPDMASKIAKSVGGPSFDKTERKNGYFKINAHGKDYCVTWGFGHLCELSDAEGYNKEYKNWSKMPIPFIPQNYEIVLKPGVKDQYVIIKRLFKDAEYIINATDFDREGELIFYYIYQYIGIKKPIERMKLSSTTDEGIKDAFNNLIPYNNVTGILESAKCRAIADWVVGCNLTAAMTLIGNTGKILSIGRVQTPTLAMVVKRDEEIASFKPEKYFTVDAEFTTEKGEKYKGSHRKKKFNTEKEADTVIRNCYGKNGKIVKIEKKTGKKEVPLLYNLNSLQMEANSKFGYSLKKTLDIMQRLYEKGFVSYPRTDSQYLPEDMPEQISKIQMMLKDNGYGNLFTREADKNRMLLNRKRFFDDKKIDSHYAIIPTYQIPQNIDKEEKNIYDLIADSVIRMLYPAADIATTKIITSVGNEEFVSDGTMVENPGWLVVHGNIKEVSVPTLKEGETVTAKTEKSEKMTKPPAKYTEKTLLSAMISAGKNLEDDELKSFMVEHKIEGIGTVATRAGIIESLVSRKYIEKIGKNIVSTSFGRNLIHTIPVDDVKSVALTASYEKRLNLIAEYRENSNSFLNDIYANVNEWCKKINSMQGGAVKMDGTGIKCPICGKELRKMNWGYGCSGYDDGCRFSVSGTIAGKSLTDSQMKELIEKRKIGPVSGFKSKTGKRFEASVLLKPVEENGEIVSYKTEFEFPQTDTSKYSDIETKCPKCGADIVKERYGWICQNKCISVPYEICGREIPHTSAEALFSLSKTDVLDNFISKKGKKFSASLYMGEDGKIKFDFDN